MNYQETLDYLFNTLPMFSRIGAAAFKKNLTNTIALCEALGNPQQQFKSIHIAGTNGKGSTSHMLAAVLQTAGYKTGLYTSPHLKDFRERIKVNGSMCEESFVIDFTEKIQPLIQEIQPSFFEITVAMAFYYFAQQKVDIAVIEVGLGGRLDSTNIIHPEVGIITNISWDHMNMLGDTLEKIAGEKAGIIKANIPIVIGETLPETLPVFAHTAKEKNAPLILSHDEFYPTDWQYNHHHLAVTIAEKRNDERTTYTLDLPGVYQVKNLPAVLSTIHLLQQRGWNISKEDVLKGLLHTKRLTGLHGRWELISHDPAIILDVCHNEDGIRQMTAQLELASYRELHLILGMVKDKDITKILPLLPKAATYYFTKAQIPRALPETELAAIANDIAGLQGQTFPNVQDALAHAKQHAHKEDLILVCGSVFLVGEV